MRWKLAGACAVTVALGAACGSGGTGNEDPVDRAPAATASVAATVNLTFDPDSVRIATGGAVTWNFAGVSHNVVFNSAAGTPDDVGTTSNASVARNFTTAGTFNYRCTIHAAMNGKVVVQNP